MLQARQLNLQNPKCKRNCKEDYKSFIRSEELDKLAFELQEELLTRLFNKEMQQQYELLYEKRKEGMLEAERKCRKLRIREVARSRTLQYSMDTIQL